MQLVLWARRTTPRKSTSTFLPSRHRVAFELPWLRLEALILVKRPNLSTLISYRKGADCVFFRPLRSIRRGIICRDSTRSEHTRQEVMADLPNFSHFVAAA